MKKLKLTSNKRRKNIIHQRMWTIPESNSKKSFPCLIKAVEKVTCFEKCWIKWSRKQWERKSFWMTKSNLLTSISYYWRSISIVAGIEPWSQGLSPNDFDFRIIIYLNKLKKWDVLLRLKYAITFKVGLNHWGDKT